MSKPRWQPPAMSPPSGKSVSPPGTTSSPSSSKLKVDEQVVRKMLKVNPALRAGRTTGQVKKDLERGEPLIKPEPSLAVASEIAPIADAASQLRDTVRFFLGGKAETLATTRDAIEARRQALDAELAAAKATLREQVLAFVALLDASTVDAHGAAALAEHSSLLRELGLDARNLAEVARRKNR